MTPYSLPLFVKIGGRGPSKKWSDSPVNPGTPPIYKPGLINMGSTHKAGNWAKQINPPRDPKVTTVELRMEPKRQRGLKNDETICRFLQWKMSEPCDAKVPQASLERGVPDPYQRHQKPTLFVAASFFDRYHLGWLERKIKGPATFWRESKFPKAKGTEATLQNPGAKKGVWKTGHICPGCLCKQIHLLPIGDKEQTHICACIKLKDAKS